jgi:hypothetical protein
VKRVNVNAGNPYILALVAVAGTILGTLVSGLIQFLVLRRQIYSAARDAELDRLGELERWARSAIEVRYQDLWRERRLLYTRLIATADEWYDAIRDLRSSAADWSAHPEKLVEMGKIHSRIDVSAASPVAAAWVSKREEFHRCMREMEILAHASVLDIARQLHMALIHEGQAALDAKTCDEFIPAIAALCKQMRAVLTKPHIPQDLEYETPRPRAASTAI